MKINDVTKCIEEFAPLSYQESYDNSGLIVGQAESNLTGILLCLDCIEDVIDEAIKLNCNLVIAHHPIVFSGIKQLNGKNYIERTIIKAIQHNIAIYAAHTNADNATNGVNYKIASKLELTDCKILAPKKGQLKKLVTYCPLKDVETIRKAIFNAGAGTIGKYDQCSFNSSGHGTFRGNESSQPHVGEAGKLHIAEEVRIETVFPSSHQHKIINALISAHPYEEVAYDIYSLDNKHPSIGSGLIGNLKTPMDAKTFLQLVKKQFNVPVIKHTKIISSKINKVALCGGSGSFLLHDAIQQNACIFITADMKYHQFFDAEDKLIIADIGHYESEQFTTELFYEILKEKFATFAIHFSEVNTNPVNYL